MLKSKSKIYLGLPESEVMILNNVIQNLRVINVANSREKKGLPPIKSTVANITIDINGKNIDAVEVTVERYDKTATNPTPDKYTYNIWVKGGVKIDISGGLFLTSLMDKQYDTKDDGSNKFIFEKSRYLIRV